MLPLPEPERRGYTPFVKGRELALAGLVSEGMEMENAFGFRQILKTSDAFHGIGSRLAGSEPDGFFLTYMSDPPRYTDKHVPSKTKPGADTTVSNNLAKGGHVLQWLGLSGSFPFKKNILLRAVIGLPSIFAVFLLTGPVNAAPGRSVLLVGDSVMAALSGPSTNAAQAIIGADGWTVSIDARVCRKSTTPGCLRGSPSSALEVLRTRHNRQSTVVVIMVGHNDDRGPRFREKVSAILDEVSDAPQVFWVSMREVSKSYVAANRVI